MPAKQLNPLVLNDLGIYGLNSQANPAALPPQWLSKADNIILDEQGRISSRKGIQQVSTSVSGEVVQSLAEYRGAGGTTTLFCGTNGDIYKINTANTPYTLDAQTRTGTPQTITGGHWQWVNFNEKLYGFQNGHTPVYYSGSTWTDLVDLGSYNAPPGITTFDPNCALGEYGRLWVGGITENANVVYYSDTLQGDKWNTGASGQLDLKSVWGNDYIMDIAAFMGKLVIFGTQNIAIYNNPYDPNELQLDELIEGIGLKARDSVAHLGDDIVFLSNTGVRSLARTVTSDGKMPLRNFSKNIRDELALSITTSDMTECKAAYCLCGGFYMLAFPDRNIIYYMDFTIVNPDVTPRISKFVFDKGDCPTAFLSTTDGSMWLGRNNNAANIAKYQNYFDQIKNDVTSTSATYNGSLEIELDLSTSTAGSPAAYDATEAEAYCETQLGGSYDTGTKKCTLTVDVNDTAPTPDTNIVDPTFTWSGAGTDYCTLGGFTYSGGSCTIPLNTAITCRAVGNTWESTNSECWSTTNLSYTGAFRTTWLDFSQSGSNSSITKILKEFYGVIVGGKDMTVDFTWYRDYNVEGTTQSFALGPTGGGVPYLWGASTSLYGVARYAPSYNPTEYKLPLSRAGKVIQIEMKAGIYGYKASLQGMALHAKEGKIR